VYNEHKFRKVQIVHGVRQWSTGKSDFASNTLCCQVKTSHVFMHNTDPLKAGFRETLLVNAFWFSIRSTLSTSTKNSCVIARPVIVPWSVSKQKHLDEHRHHGPSFHLPNNKITNIRTSEAVKPGFSLYLHPPSQKVTLLW
jgi:hypothetical protein